MILFKSGQKVNVTLYRGTSKVVADGLYEKYYQDRQGKDITLTLDGYRIPFMNPFEILIDNIELTEEKDERLDTTFYTVIISGTILKGEDFYYAGRNNNSRGLSS